MTKTNRLDIYQTITDQIVAAIEAGAGDFEMPWHRTAGSTMRPVNIATGKPYQGINILNLWIAAESHGYSSPVWGTFKQWLANGTPVRKGEKATLAVFYKDIAFKAADPDTGEETEREGRLARAFWLFNSAQAEGYVAPEGETFEAAIIDPLVAVDALIEASGAVVVHEGDRAYYRPANDTIYLPSPGRFKGSRTMTPTEAYYATKGHEWVHWSGAKHRLDRDLSGRFGSAAYAMDELVAELGSAYLCAELGITPIARPDHAQYIATWLKVLKADKRAIFHAAGQAQRAATYLMGFGPPESPDPEPERSVVTPSVFRSAAPT